MKKTYKKYNNRIKNDTGVEARHMASAGYGPGYEELDIHKLYVKGNHMSPYIRGRLKTSLNTGRRRRALINAAVTRTAAPRWTPPAHLPTVWCAAASW